MVKNLCLMVGLTAGVAVIAPADAVVRVVSSNATNYCQAALPVFDTSIRKRPLSVQNEGSSTAFVTCSFHSEEAVSAAEIWLHAAAGQTVTCTGVAGYNGASEAAVKSAVVGAGETQAWLSWNAADFPGGSMSSGLFSVSCGLQPGQGLDDTYLGYDDGTAAPASAGAVR